jgi:hypothetical protein
VQSGELSVSSAAKLARMPYARYLQHLGALGYSMLDPGTDATAELDLLQRHLPAATQASTDDALPPAAKQAKRRKGLNVELGAAAQ